MTFQKWYLSHQDLVVDNLRVTEDEEEAAASYFVAKGVLGSYLDNLSFVTGSMRKQV